MKNELKTLHNKCEPMFEIRKARKPVEQTATKRMTSDFGGLETVLNIVCFVFSTVLRGLDNAVWCVSAYVQRNN